MLAYKHIDKVIAFVLLLVVLFTALFVLRPDLLGMEASDPSAPYLEKLFDKDAVSSIEISMPEEDWQEMLDTAVEEKYFSCDISINGESYRSVGIRPKGNSSLMTVAQSDSDRYSFKVKMDEYVEGQNYYGLSKFVINNMQGDASYMREYLSYDLFAYMGVATPAYAFSDISVNGAPWGLYLAVEVMEQEFASRTFGADYGQLYKPETVDMGDRENISRGAFGPPEGVSRGAFGLPEGISRGAFDPPESVSRGGFDPPEGVSRGAFGPPEGGRGFSGGDEPGGGADLVYTDDDPDSYAQIFDEAVFGQATEAEKARVIAALKILAEEDDPEKIEQAVDVDGVLRYFAVNTVLVNLDSYVSNLKHNYYLYEKEGVLSILPWDLNLSFAGFQNRDAASAVDFSIDTPVSGVELSERPLIGKLLAVDEYKERYHHYLEQIVTGYFDDGQFLESIEKLDALIGEKVKQDATAFYDAEQYEKGVDELKKFGMQRAERVREQVGGR